MRGNDIRAIPRMQGTEWVRVRCPNRRSSLVEMNGNDLPMILARVSMSGRRDDTAMTAAFTRLSETPIVVRMRR
jgi:hypothetical protein